MNELASPIWTPHPHDLPGLAQTADLVLREPWRHGVCIQNRNRASQMQDQFIIHWLLVLSDQMACLSVSIL